MRSVGEPDVVAMLDRVSDGVAVLNSDWRFSYVNLPAAAMLRRPRDELLGRSIWSQFPDAGAGEPFPRAFEEALRDRRPVTYTGYYPPLGRWFESRCFPRDDQHVVRSIIGIAEQFGLKTIAEGVEHAETVNLLTEMGTHYAQGFHLGFLASVAQTGLPAAAAHPH